MKHWSILIEWLLLVVLAGLLLLVGFLFGAGHGMAEVRQQAIDEGYAVREPAGGIRWKTTDDLRRRR